MLTVVVLFIAVPCAVVRSGPNAAGQAADTWLPTVRGIALQTVIIMVVLLAIAGGVAAVLLNRGGEAVTDIERQQISRQASEFSGSALCNAAGFVLVLRFVTVATPLLLSSFCQTPARSLLKPIASRRRSHTPHREGYMRGMTSSTPWPTPPVLDECACSTHEVPENDSSVRAAGTAAPRQNVGLWPQLDLS